jgi:transcriptional regulator with XRE-family HTH domain
MCVEAFGEREVEKETKFGSIIREARIRKELHLRDFWQLTGKDPSNWSKVERGVLPPPTDVFDLIRLCELLELDFWVVVSAIRADTQTA